jgi:hypothetical protein
MEKGSEIIEITTDFNIAGPSGHALFGTNHLKD